MDPVLEQFLGEARDNLAFLDGNLKYLKDGDKDKLNALFRAAHTLKGGAGLVGFDSVKTITHAAENLLDAFRGGKLSFSDSLLDVLYDAFDEVVELIDGAEELGQTDVSVDQGRIDSINSSIRSFLEITNPPKEWTPPVVLASTLSLQSIKSIQLAPLLEDIRVSSESITEENFQDRRQWIIELDLDTQTIRLGNDPFYALYLLGPEAIIAMGITLFGDEDSDPLEWQTHIVLIVEANYNEIEEALYNMLDEIKIAPLSLESIFYNNLPSADTSLIEPFKEEVKIGEIDGFNEKLRAIAQVINPDTKEGYIFGRLCELHEESGYDKLIPIALKELGVEVMQKPSITKNAKVDLNSKEHSAAVEILKAQRKILSHPGSFERTKQTLKGVLGYLGEEANLQQAKNPENLIDIIDGVLTKGQVPPKESQIPPVKSEVSHKEPELSNKIDIQTSPAETKKEPSAMPKTIKINQEEIDGLMDIVGEVLVIKNALPYIAQGVCETNIEQTKREIMGKYEEISRITTQLQDRVMGMRLLPISYIFSRYPKLVRDISKQLGKQIEYHESGGETKLDKMMIEKLADPLIHVIRNSLDHGIESENERATSGKPSKGNLWVKARSEGDRVYIEISDDGKGIDVDNVVQKALEKGLVDPNSLDELTHNERLKLIFLPGLSTKEAISDLSGRGVGADAVNSTVDELGGKIHLKSTLGKGTTVTLELPVSVALTSVFHVLMNSVHFGIPMDHIIETETFEKEAVKTANHKPFISVRGEVIPLAITQALVGRMELKEHENALIIKSPRGKIALIVDQFVGELDVVQKPLSGMLKSHPLINGVSLLGDGSPLFILNTTQLFAEQ